MLSRLNFMFICQFFCLTFNQAFANETFELGVEKQLAVIEEMTNNDDKTKALSRLESRKVINSAERIMVLEVIEQHYRSLKDFTRAIMTLEKIIALSQNSQTDLYFARANKRLGIYHYLKGDYEQSIAFYQPALDYFQQNESSIDVANLHNNIGLAQAAMGSNIQAIESYQQAEMIYQASGSEQDKIDIRFNIAGLYLRLERYDMAITAFLSVIERREAINDQKGLAAVYSDIGVSYKHSGKPFIALEYMDKALQYYLQQEDLFFLAAIYHNIAEVHYLLGQHDKVLTFAGKSIKISESHDYKTSLSGALYSYAKSLFFLGKTEEALTYLMRSEKIVQALQYAKQIEKNLALFSLIYAAKNQPQKALAVHQKYIITTNNRENNNLNVLLADYEAKVLKQQVERLKNKEKLQQLSSDKALQKRNFTVFAIVLILLVTFFILRRNSERKSKFDLVSKVKQRTKDLELLTHKLQEANKVKSLFLANMSHEIRTPLTAILAQSETMLEESSNPEYLRDEVEIIYNNSLHLLELINNILDLSKVEANKLDLEIQPQDLHQSLQEVANMFNEQAKNKGLNFTISHQLPVPFVISMDSFRIKQVLINLCSNAIKFTASGHVKVKVVFVEEQLLFSVEDTGIGLSSSQVQSVFESFTQGESSISRRFGGTGLGLSLSDQLAKLMGGRIEIASTLNQGSCFTFVMPCKDVNIKRFDSDTFLSPTVVEAEKEKMQPVMLTGSILLAEDHQDNRLLISRLLSSLGLDVITANNGKEAVALFIEHCPQVILLDIQMPEMDGIEAHNIMRQHGATQPIIAVTANAMSHEVEQYLSLGFDDHLKKPIERKVFIETISQYYQETFDIDNAEKAIEKVDMSDLIEQFKSNLVLEQQDIILHIKNSDYQALSLLVHRIAGAAQMFGFAVLSQHAIALELTIKNNELALINELSQSLLNEIDQVLW